MRTILNIEEEVVNAVKEIARRQRRTAGAVISNLARQALIKPASESEVGLAEPKPFVGFRPFAAEGRVVSKERVEYLREEEGI